MKITDLPDAELLRLADAVARCNTAEPVLVDAVHTELVRRLEAASALIEQREREYGDACHRELVEVATGKRPGGPQR